ncbi:hypothetical protein G3480_05615 [Thiorhodococcus mannitoliphagus]|uniref:Uncharacterized protein n=1 Tax=Thiorhodococcus mannitoliphagus TaxID=329406 RepID=A0A6P1DVT8_9GAMM|nr:hypothetical protein [Thiorhodococcus mannitoliphagus]NEX19794.1 hypothetical protein [Thiorhodococcus mannitoliphagus]
MPAGRSANDANRNADGGTALRSTLQGDAVAMVEVMIEVFQDETADLGQGPRRPTME